MFCKLATMDEIKPQFEDSNNIPPNLDLTLFLITRHSPKNKYKRKNPTFPI